MTNKEALLATLQVSVPDSSLDLALINAGIDGTDTYTASNQAAIEKCAVPLLYGLFTAPDIKEGDYAISYQDFYRKLKERLLYLANKHDLTDIVELVEPKPTVTSRSVW